MSKTTIEVECWFCGESLIVEDKPVEMNFFGKYIEERNFHEDCKPLYRKRRDEIKEEYIRLKIEVMFERALRMMEKQDGFHINDYKEASEVVGELARKDPKKFDSSHEMMAAMELINNRIHTKVQYPLNKRRIDMLLPSLKVALEIDGVHHNFIIGKDSDRDIEILNELNKNDKGWEIVRIPTKIIEKNLKELIPTIRHIYKEKQDLRRRNGGFIPSYYSRTNLSAHLKAVQGVNDPTVNSYRDAVFREDSPS